MGLVTNWDALIGKRKDLDKSRQRVQLDLDVDPVRGRGLSERASGRAAGMTEAGQERPSQCFFFLPRFAFLRPSFLVLCSVICF